jgi:hypothetical protein
MALFRREPERSKLVLKIGAAGLVAVAAWALLAPLALPAIVVIPVFVLLLAVYGTMMVVLAADLVRSLDRYQVESAVHARRLMSTTLTATAGAAAAESGVSKLLPRPSFRPDPEDLLAPNFYDWYFSIRLEEEVKKSRREGASMAVVVMHVAPHSSDPSHAEIEQIDIEMAKLASDHQDKLKIPTALDILEYGFYLPGMDSFAAKALVSRLVSHLGDYWCYYGIAVYPDDASNGEGLLNQARELCEASVPRAVA